MKTKKGTSESDRIIEEELYPLSEKDQSIINLYCV